MPLRLRPAHVLAAVSVGIPLALTGGIAAAAAPPAPTEVSCTPSGTGQVDIWTYSVWAELTSTEIRDAVSGQVWTLKGDAVGAPYDATVTGLNPNRQYSLQFRYTDSTGTSAWSTPCKAVYPRPIAGNLVLNPSADLGLKYWKGVNAGLSLAAGGSPGWGGASSIQVARTSGATYGLADAARGGLPTVIDAEDESYEAAAWVKAASASAIGKSVTISLREQNAQGSTVHLTAGRAATLTSSWQQVWVTAPLLGAGDNVGVLIQQRGAGAGDAIAVDDVRVHPVGSLFQVGSEQTARTVDSGVKRAVAKDMTPCSEWADFWFNCEVERDLTSYRAYVDGLAGGSGSASIRGVIYADTGSGPGALIASTKSVVVKSGQTAGWVDLPLQAPVELGSRVYWFGYQVGGAGKVVRFYGDDSTYFCDCGYPIGIWNSDAYSDGPSSSFGAYQAATLNTDVLGSGGR